MEIFLFGSKQIFPAIRSRNQTTLQPRTKEVKKKVENKGVNKIEKNPSKRKKPTLGLQKDETATGSQAAVF